MDFDFLFRVEERFNVGRARANGVAVWPLIRLDCHFQHINKTVGEAGSAGLLEKIAGTLRNLFYGITNWIGGYDYVVYTNTTEYRLMDGFLANKLTVGLDELLDEDRILYLEEPTPRHFRAGKRHLHVVSATPIRLLAYLLKNTIYLRVKGEGWSVFEEVNKAYDLNINYGDLIRWRLACIKAQEILLKIIKPRLVFTTNYGVYHAKAAHNHGIKVVEFQHGLISKSHPAFQSRLKLDETFYPDHLLVFGENDGKLLEDSKIYGGKNIHVIGSRIIEYMHENREEDEELKSLSRDYELTVAVTLQWTVQEELTEFIREAAVLDGEILYLMIPRNRDDVDSMEGFPDNMHYWTKTGFYEAVAAADYHTSVYSTCSLEAPSLGVQNILADIDGQAEKHLGERLKDPDVTAYAKTPGEYVKTLREFQKLDGKKAGEKNKKNIKPGYQYNLERFLRETKTV